MTSRECEILKHILSYCREISETVARFGDSLELLQADLDYRKSVAMSVLQIGELSTHLSEEFRSEHPGVPWRDIRGMRNVVAHHYGKMDETLLFEIVHQDVPELESFLEKLLAQPNLFDSEQEPSDRPSMTI
jgi:uncharacterized protein with HEPN domain